MKQIKKFPILENEIQLSRPIKPHTYCEAVGQKSAALGYEEGSFEIWVYPFKILHDFQLAFYIEKYNLNINGKDIARQIIVRPELTTLIYSHDLFTLQQHILAPIHEAGVILLLDLDVYCPLTVFVNFQPDLVPMWPAGLGGQYTLWFEDLQAYYIGEGSRKYAALIGSPGAKRQTGTPGHQLPDEPMRFALNLTPEKNHLQFLPIIVTASILGREDAVAKYHHLLDHIPQLYADTHQHYQRLHKDFTSVITPNAELNLAYEWAKVSLDKGYVDNPQLGKGLVAGYGVAGKTQRPGFAWYFGGDAFLNAFAIVGYGDFETIKQTLAFFMEHQRDDGKIPHECSQSAGLIHWFEGYPYAYYHADTTPYFIVAMHHYVTTSGDKMFLTRNWNVLLKAFKYCISTDRDDDGLMENSAAGLAAMEVGTMLANIKIDVYLASVWIKALQCMAELARIIGDNEIQHTSDVMLKKASDSFQKIFIHQNLHFALLENGDIISEPTVWQALPFFFHLVHEDQANQTFEHFASAAMSTDWGVRGVSQESQHYDPISYNTGSVWPFTTGYVSTAEYRYHRCLNGYAHLIQNVYLTQLDAIGWHPELLSGEFFRPVSTSVPHQLFSASGILIPLFQGLLGLSANALEKEITFAPHLPCSWQELVIRRFRVGQNLFDLQIKKNENSLKLEIKHHGTDEYNLIFTPALGLKPNIMKATVAGKDVNYELFDSQYDTHCKIETSIKVNTTIEIIYQPGMEFEIPLKKPEIGDRTTGLKFIDYHLASDRVTITFEGRAGQCYRFKLRTRFVLSAIEGGKIVEDSGMDKAIEIKFDEDKNQLYKRKVVKIDYR